MSNSMSISGPIAGRGPLTGSAVEWRRGSMFAAIGSDGCRQAGHPRATTTRADGTTSCDCEATRQAMRTEP